MRLVSCIFLFVAVICLSSCKWVKEQEFQEKALCRVYDDLLYPSDLIGLVGPEVNKEDSMRIVKSYVDFWVKQRLMLKKAKDNIKIKKAELKRKVDDYHNTLVIYDYEQAMLQEKLDTGVTELDIENYYKDFEHNFLTKTHWVKLDFIKIDPKAPKIDSLPIWLNGKKISYRESLSDFCYQYAEEFTLDTAKWFDFEIIMKHVPLKLNNPVVYLKSRRYSMVQDSIYRYYLKVHALRLKGEVKPLGLVKDNIKHLIVNKRQKSFLEKLRNNVYNSAQNNEFEIY